MTATASEKPLPHNLEAERALLGSILLGPEALPTVVKILGTYDFYSEAHRITFAKMLWLAERKTTIDLVTLSEEISKDGLLEKAGGAAYLSALTDGVPIGTTAAVPEYCRIIKEYAQKRDILRDGYELSQQVAEGAPPEEIAAQAEKLVRKAEAPKRAVAPGALYPEIPPEAWLGISAIYRTAMQKTSEASDNFHFATFLSIAAVILGKSVAVGTDEDDLLFPNVFTVIVGDSGSCKDRATKRGIRLLRHVDSDVIQLPDIASIQGFIAELSDERKELEARKVQGPLRTIVRLSELAPLIVKADQKATKDLVPKLNEAYDCPAFLRSRTKSDPVKVEEPAISILACTTPDLADVQLSDLKRGLGSRCFFIPGSRKPPDRHDHPPDSECAAAVKNRLAQLAQHYPLCSTKIIPFSPEAEARLDRWYNFQATHQPGDDLMKFLGVRDIVHVYKISLILCALDLRHRIEDFHVAAAIAFVDWLRDVRPLVFEGHGLSPTMQAQRVVERIVKERMEISYADALKLFSRTGDAMLFKRIVDAESVPGGPIEVKFVGERRPKRFLSWRG
ncbi:MAG: DnaB-like helicase N-terminal domain-containing protein [Terriglobia bacterium]